MTSFLKRGRRAFDHKVLGGMAAVAIATMSAGQAFAQQEPLGRCCLGGSLGPTCLIITEAECTSSEEFLDWEENGRCTNGDESCAKGACCFPSGGCVRTVGGTCDTLGGTFQGAGTDCVTSNCPTGCAGDVNGDGVVNVQDLLEVIMHWGPCTDAVPCLADLNGDSMVNVADLVLVIVNWGECPTGACCLVDGSCVDVTLAECNAQMGDYQGDATRCEDVVCPVQCTGGIGDFVWIDENADGIQDDGEPGLAGVTVRLFLGCDESSASFLAETTTDDTGYYEFTGLCAGDYLVVFDDENLTDGFVETEANQGDDDCKDSDCENGRVCVNLPTHDTFDDCVDCGFKPPSTCCEFGKPVQLTFRYTGEDCSASSNTQAGDECDDFGDLLDTVYVVAGKQSDCDNNENELYFEGAVSMGETLVVERPDGNTFPSSIYLCIYDGAGGTLLQQLKIHTSCSQDLFTGDQFGSVVLVDCVGEDEPQEGDCCANGNKPDDLTFQYTGEGCSASDNTQDKDECEDFGTLPGTVYVIAGKQSDCDNNADETFFEGFVSVDETFVVQKPSGGDLPSDTHVCIYDAPDGTLLQKVKIHTSCSQDLFVGNQFGSLLLVACDSEEPPGGNFDCDGKIVEMTMIWNGTDVVTITAWDGSVGSDLIGDFGPLVPGDEVTVGPLSGPNDSIWEIFDLQTGQKIGESKFHRSCSDSDMNGPEDCGKAQGNGKSNDDEFLNDWILEGLVDEAGQVLDCSAP